MTVWFDVEDIFDYFQSGHRRLSGIQRLGLEIYRAALEIGGESVRLVRHAPAPDRFEVVQWADIASQLAAGERSAARPSRPRSRTTFRTRVGRVADRQLRRMPDELRKPLVLGVSSQLGAIGQLGRFGLNLALHPAANLARSLVGNANPLRIRAPKPLAPAQNFERLARPGDTLLVLGSPWFRRYSPTAQWLRDERRMRFGVLVHDLVPIRRPEWAVSGTARNFEEWYSDILPFCDAIFANSRNTAADVEAYLRERGFAQARPVQALPVGTGFGSPPERLAERPADMPAPGSYVLFVSTMEARKNHALVVKVWSNLLDEVRNGRRAAASVPDLVFAGRVGWLVGDLIQQLDNTDWLGGRVRMVHAPTDAGLRALYEGCLFTIFPSFHEGWGLPVTESLAFGKPCLSSNAAALPEAGGALCRYFDPEDLGDAHRAVAALLDDRPGLAAWEEQVRREFRPTPWSETARTLLDAVAEL